MLVVPTAIPPSSVNLRGTSSDVASDAAVNASVKDTVSLAYVANEDRTPVIWWLSVAKVIQPDVSPVRSNIVVMLPRVASVVHTNLTESVEASAFKLL